MEEETQKWHVLLVPGPGGTTATPTGGLYDTEEAAWRYVRTLPADVQGRARVVMWNRPGRE